ncbi:type II toxin-antitoxin system RelE/ParE family toxin [Sphingomonas sp. HH69]
MKTQVTPAFQKWFDRLKDIRARSRIAKSIAGLELGLPGDVKSVGAGVSEIRVHYGPGYRIYITRRGASLVILLVGGDKSSQDRDITAAKKIAADLENDLLQ